MTWTEARAGALDVVRVAYLREVERFAEELRPRFESGELRGLRDSDPDSGERGPFYQVEKLCLARFAPEGMAWEQIHLALAASPSAEEADDTWVDRRGHVAAAACLDVLRLASARGYYKPAPDELMPSRGTEVRS